MQITLVAILFIALLGFIIYKINNRFALKELIILVSIIVVSVLALVMLLRNEEEKVPQLFKTKYEQNRKVTISKMSYERLNNKYITSKTEFVYNFDFIISKDNKELVCEVKNVVIKKIEDEYIFENFNTMDENCQEK
ncbi:hypothetical protein [Halarcobacter ebronensis]|uniref:Uncharacterized protein n=1 Tax=Halarcobacter ebronensis TaxID=1462615 RepID=A0A4Q1AK73_9BACT|nr:hypothetical protein [Halarcobacter ebronensis]QKF81365.1 putative membrane protein [Halarcobacter ebronensis]RXK04926.1 hypothetical protein CRV07_10080 [Halarcobacter ebronensis]